METTLSIVHSLSYNILTFWRKWSYNNRDTAQRTLPCRFMFGKKWPPIDITRKYEQLCIVAFNRKFHYDDVFKMKKEVIFLCLSYNISKFGRKSITGKRDNLNWTKEIMTSSMKHTFFKFRCQYDDFVSLCRGHGGMESYLQLMLFLTMI